MRRPYPAPAAGVGGRRVGLFTRIAARSPTAAHRPKEIERMLLATDYPFLDILGTMIIFFAWLIWLWIVITVLVDVFRRHDIGGLHKAGWVLFVVLLPYVGVLIYLIAHHDGMRERSVAQAKQQQKAFDDYVRDAAGGSAAEIAKAKELLDAGTITQEEFDAIKARALS
jgi:uncharacterized membrane protein YhaH (DUF805 family)